MAEIEPEHKAPDQPPPPPGDKPIPSAPPHLQDKPLTGTAAMHKQALDQIAHAKKRNKEEREKNAAEAKKAAEESKVKKA